MEGVYVLELAPGRIKVGRSTNLAARIRAHERALIMTGGTARQSWFCAVVDSEVVETRALKAISAFPHACPVEGSREVFTGVTFLEAMSFIMDVAQTFPTARPEMVIRDEYAPAPVATSEEISRRAGLLAAVLQEMDELGVARLHTRVLADRLDLSVLELTNGLMRAGCRSLRWREGDLGNLRGWLREDVAKARIEAITAVIADHGAEGDAHGGDTPAAHTG